MGIRNGVNNAKRVTYRRRKKHKHTPQRSPTAILSFSQLVHRHKQPENRPASNHRYIIISNSTEK